MEAFDVLGDPVRRRILEHLAHGEQPAGEIAARVGRSSASASPRCRSTCACCGRAGSRRSARTGPGASTRSTRRPSTRSRTGPRACAGSGSSGWTRSGPSSPGCPGAPSGDGTRHRRGRRAPHRHHQEDSMKDFIAELEAAAHRRVGRPPRRCGPGRHDRAHLPGRRRGRVGRGHRPRAHPALVPARDGRPPGRRHLPGRGQRGRRDPRVRGPAAPAAHLGHGPADAGGLVRRRGPARAGAGRRHDPHARAHRRRAAADVDQFGPGAVGVGWDGALLGLGLHLDGGATLDPEAVLASPELRAFNVASSEAWGAALAAADGSTRRTSPPASPPRRRSTSPRTTSRR